MMRTALVTGANSGIGEATATALVEHGHRVICSGRKPEALAALAGKLGENALALTLDISDPDSVDSMFHRLPPAWHCVDALVNNAGHDRGGRRKFHELSMEDVTSVIQTNLLGTTRVTHKVMQGMVERGRGHIINVGSVQGLYAYRKATIYTATKFAIHGFSESLRLDYADTNIRVTEIMPGLVRTQFAANRWGDDASADAFYAKFDNWLRPQDVANAVQYALAQPAHVDVAQLVLQPAGRDTPAD
ncbi:MAG: SDR family oxidoreductase [Gammaproteobacteria bacterium]|nr:SDR family oxidoreductase [Gammaproteobacteria bacterium]